jgi:hypothetical protein
VVTLIYVLVCSVFASSTNTPSESALLRYFGKVKIRAGYLNYEQISLVPQMAEAGLNVAMVKLPLTDPPTPQEVEIIRNWAKVYQRYNIKFMPVINLWGITEQYGVRYKYSITLFKNELFE